MSGGHFVDDAARERHFLPVLDRAVGKPLLDDVAQDFLEIAEFIAEQILGERAGNSVHFVEIHFAAADEEIGAHDAAQIQPLI